MMGALGKGAGRDGIDRLSAVFAEVGPELEDERFPGARGGVDNHVLAVAEGGDGLLLPEIRHGDLVQPGKIGQR